VNAIATMPLRAPLAARLRARLFASPGATLVTLLLVALLGWAGWHVVEWGVLRAVAAPDYAACKALARAGACWGFVAEKWRLILFGRYPFEQQWRPALATAAVVAMLLATAAPGLWTRRGARLLGAGWGVAFAVFFALMAGGVLGLEPVGTDRWGGLPLTVILTLIGMAAATPIGIALALARRSSLAMLRSLAVGYIELVRGVPLITVLFVSAFVFPLVLPAGWRIDRVHLGFHRAARPHVGRHEQRPHQGDEGPRPHVGRRDHTQFDEPDAGGHLDDRLVASRRGVGLRGDRHALDRRLCAALLSHA